MSYGVGAAAGAGIAESANAAIAEIAPPRRRNCVAWLDLPIIILCMVGSPSMKAHGGEVVETHVSG